MDDVMETIAEEQPELNDPALPSLQSLLSKTLERQGKLDERRDVARAVRYAVWEGQSDDGLKHAEDLDEAPFPWEGASDTRVMLADDIIGEQVAILVESFFRAEVQATPTRGDQIDRARRVEALLRWLRNVKLRAELEEEVELCAQYMLGDDPALCVVGVYWQRELQNEWVDVSVDEILAQLAEAEAERGDGVAAEQAQTVAELLYDEAREEEAIGYLEAYFPTVEKPGLRRAVRELRTERTTRLPRPRTLRNLPCVKAYRLGEDIFLPEGTFNLQRTPAIFTVEYLTREELVARELEDGWDPDEIERVLENGPGKRYRPEAGEPTQDSEEDEDATLRDDLFEVWCAWRRSVDTAGVLGVWRTHWSPACGAGEMAKSGNGEKAKLSGVLKHEPVSLKDCAMPFYAFRRERLSRSLFDSRGITRVAGAAQTEIKTQRDCRTNYTQLSTLPPLKKQMRRQGVQLVFGPAAELPMDRGDDIAFVQPPPFPQASIEMENAVRADVNRYFGREGDDTPPSKVDLMRSRQVRGWLNGWAWVFQQVLYLCQRNLDPETVITVTGGAPEVLQRDEIGGDFELQVSFDVRELNLEFLQTRMDYYGKILPLDTQGQIDRAMLVAIAARGVDPNLADRLVRDVGVVTAKEAADEVDAIAKIAVGIEVPPPEQANWQLRLQVLEETVQRSPQLVARLQQDPDGFGKAIQARREAFVFQLQQAQNAVTGRTGFLPTQSPTMATAAAAR